jgi:phosphatidate phosphatase PAH1
LQAEKLPLGPVFCAPLRLLAALKSEVYLKNTEEAKLNSLMEVKKLFKQNPFVAGFGNNDNVEKV